VKKQTMSVFDAVKAVIATGEYTVETLEQADARAYEAFKQVMDAAFKADGMRGVTDTADSLSEQLHDLVQEAALNGEDSDTQGQIAANFVSQAWGMEMMNRFEKLEAAGGIQAVIAAAKKPASAKKPAAKKAK
jgi:hypothetical protein